MSFLWTTKSFHLVLHVALLDFIQMNLREPEAPSFTWVLLPTVSLGKTKSSRIIQCVSVRVQLRGLGGAFAASLYGFLELLRQNSPLSDKDNMLPTELFL